MTYQIVTRLRAALARAVAVIMTACGHLRAAAAGVPRRTYVLVVMVLAVLVAAGVMVWYRMTFPSIADPFGHDARFCVIDDYGASKDDPRATVAAFAAAFAACAPGGTVVVPWGTWTSGGIRVPSDVTLRLDPGAVLAFATDPALYLPVVPTRFEGMDVMNYMPPIYVPDASHVAIIGHGMLAGNGLGWWEWQRMGVDMRGEDQSAVDLHAMAEAGVPLEQRVFGSAARRMRPSFVQFYQARDVIVDGITLVDGPMWTLHAVYSQNVTVRNVTVNATGPNTDGIAVDSTSDVLIENVRIASGDDAIVIKSGQDEDGRQRGIPSRHVTIRNATVTRGNGGVTIGSEMSGGVEDVTVDGVILRGVETGIRIKTLVGRGGFVRNISYRNIVMENVVEDAIQIDTSYDDGVMQTLDRGDLIPDLRDITIVDVRVDGADRALRIDGSAEIPVRNLHMERVRITADKAGRIQGVDGGTFTNLAIVSANDKPLWGEDLRNVTFSGAVGGTVPFMDFRGKLFADVVLDLTPCPDDACVTMDKDVPAGAIRFGR